MPNFGFILMNTAKNLRQNLAQVLAPADVTVTQWAVLAALARLEQAQAATLVTALGIDKPTMSGVVNRLTTKGWLVGTADPTDHRAKLLRLSPAGQRVYATCLPLANQVTTAFLAPLSNPEQAHLRQLLQRLNREEV